MRQRPAPPRAWPDAVPRLAQALADPGEMVFDLDGDCVLACCPPQRVAERLMAEVAKGDPVDVALFALLLQQQRVPIEALANACRVTLADEMDRQQHRPRKDCDQ